eukprot:EG_transcript_10239
MPASQLVTIDVAHLVKEFHRQCCEKHKGFETRTVLRGLQEFNALATVLNTHLLPVINEVAGALIEAVQVWKTKAVLEEVWRCAATVCRIGGLAVGAALLPPFVEALLEMAEWHYGCLKALSRMLHTSGPTLGPLLRQRLEYAVLQRFLTQHSTRDLAPPSAAQLCLLVRIAMACATASSHTHRPTYLGLLTKVLLLADAFPHPKVRATAASGLLQLAALLHPQSPAVAQPTAEVVAELYRLRDLERGPPSTAAPPTANAPAPTPPPLAAETAAVIHPAAEAAQPAAAEAGLAGAQAAPAPPPHSLGGQHLPTEPPAAVDLTEVPMSLDGPAETSLPFNAALEAVLPSPAVPAPSSPPPPPPPPPKAADAVPAAPAPLLAAATPRAPQPTVADAKREPFHTIVGPTVPNYVAMDVDDEEDSEDGDDPDAAVAVPDIVTSESESDEDDNDGMDD